MAAYDDLNVKRIFVVGIASVVVTAVTALAVQVLYYSLVQWQQSETSAASDYRRQNRILEEQSQTISSYGVDEETGNIRIPIDKAIELIVSEKGKSPQPSDSTQHQTQSRLNQSNLNQSNPVQRRTVVMQRNSSIGQFARVIFGTLVALAVAAASDWDRCAVAQGLQSAESVTLNDGVPREVENVTVEQKLGGQVPLDLTLTDSLGREVKTGYFIDGKKPTIVHAQLQQLPDAVQRATEPVDQVVGRAGSEDRRGFPDPDGQH